MHKIIMHYGFMELMLKTWKWNLNKTIISVLQFWEIKRLAIVVGIHGKSKEKLRTGGTTLSEIQIYSIFNS